jgi:YVTN family beta-propeller protein
MQKSKMPVFMFVRATSLLMFAGLFLSGTTSWAVAPLKTIAVGHAPGPIAVNPSAHLAYVVNQSADTVSAIDTLQLKVKKVITVGSSPVAIAANPPGGLVYVANSGAGTISAIKGTAAALTWTVGGKPFALVVDAGLNLLYVADSSLNQVDILNATTGAVLAVIPTTQQPTAMALNVATHYLFVACTGASGSIVVIDGAHKQIVTTVGSIPPGTTSISIDPITNVAALASPTANIYTVVDAANGYSVLQEPGDAGADPIATAYDAGGPGFFFVADTGDGNIFFADGTGIVTLGNAYQTHLSGAGGLAINPTTNQMGVVYPAGFGEIIDLENPLFPMFYHSVTTGANPTALAFDPLTNRVFFTNTGDNTVSVVDITPSAVAAAFEKNFNGFDLIYDYIDANPATGTTYTLRLGDLFAINEAQAGAGTGSAGVTTIPLASPYCQAVVVNSATNKIYVGDSQGNFYSVDGATNVASLVSSVPPTADIRALAVDSDTNQIVAWDYANNNILILDSSSDSLLKTIPIPVSAVSAIFVDPIKNLAYVASKPVSVIDPVAGTIVATIPVSDLPLVAAMNPAASRLYVATTASADHVYVIDTSKNSIVTTVTLPGYNLVSIGVNPASGNYYIGMTDGATNHVLVYSGTKNTLLSDLSSAVYPQITGVATITVNSLRNTVYVGSDFGSTTSVVATIDGSTGAVSSLAPSTSDNAAHALAVDLGSGILAGAGTSYTTLWFPTSDVSGGSAVPIKIAAQGIPDSMTIATAPIFRTRNVKPKFTISATSNFAQNAAALVPQHGFYQLDGWQGAWKAAKLVAKKGSLTSTANVTLPALSTGRHILYVYATDGDVATIQESANGANSPVISSIASVVFTVEK